MSDVNFCKDHRNKIEVPDPLAVEDLIVTVYVKQEKHILLKEFKPLNLMVLTRKMKLCISVLCLGHCTIYSYSFSSCNVFPYF